MGCHDANRDPTTGVMPILPGQPPVAASGPESTVTQEPAADSEDSDVEQYSENGHSTTTEAGDTTESDPDDIGAWSNAEDTDYYTDFPSFAFEKGSLVGHRVAQKFNDGWSVGTVKGVENDRRKMECGLYFVKHASDFYPFYDPLSAEYYGSESGWVLLKNKAQSNKRRKK